MKYIKYFVDWIEYKRNQARMYAILHLQTKYIKDIDWSTFKHMSNAFDRCYSEIMAYYIKYGNTQNKDL